MYNETGRGEAPQRNRKEIQDRLDQLAEIIDVVGQTNEKGRRALSEQADLRNELADLEAAEAKRFAEPAKERPSQPMLAPKEKAVLQERENFNKALAKEMSTLMRFESAHPEISLALTRLRDSKNVQRFIDDKVEIEFFTREIKRDPKARQIVQQSLERLYKSATGKSYVQKSEAAWPR
jgi:hypothetical protein